jgi:hypothetical protein
MEREFPVLQLCSRHWKADHVWILNYPSWLRNWEKKVKRGKDKITKCEDDMDVIEFSTADLSLKRKHHTAGTTCKKCKMDNPGNIEDNAQIHDSTLPSHPPTMLRHESLPPSTQQPQMPAVSELKLGSMLVC